MPAGKRQRGKLHVYSKGHRKEERRVVLSAHKQELKNATKPAGRRRGPVSERLPWEYERGPHTAKAHMHRLSKVV